MATNTNVDLTQCNYPPCLLESTQIVGVFTVRRLKDNTLIGVVRINDQIVGRIDPIVEPFLYIENRGDFHPISPIIFGSGETIFHPATLPRGIVRAQQQLLDEFEQLTNNDQVDTGDSNNG